MSTDFEKPLVISGAGNGFELRPLAAGDDPLASQILADATSEGSAEAALAFIDQARAGGDDRVIGGWLEESLIGAYTLERDGAANQIRIIAVTPEHRRKGFGKLMLFDALRRSGSRPVTAETDDDALDFYKSCGFKLVGRRKHPSGETRYRVGWHAPRPGAGQQRS